MQKTRPSFSTGQLRASMGTPHSGHGQMSLGELIFIGVGGIIGAGFFLGCGLPIQTAGPAVLVAFLIGAVITSQVIGALTSISVSYPVQGSFKVYADMYLGRFAGFMQGWVYYLTGILTISSEAVAMAIFTRVWIPWMPLWVSASVFAAFILLLNAFGVKSFGRVESFMSIIKIAAIVGFVLFALFMLFGVHTTDADISRMGIGRGFFPHGVSGLLQSMLIVIFSFSGIGVFGTATAEMREPKQIDDGALWTTCLLTILYLASIGTLLMIQPWSRVDTSASPFVVALKDAGTPIFADVFNAVILIASFSVMAGTVFSANQILFSLGKSFEAPSFVTKTSRRGVQYGALILTTILIAIAIGASYILPSNVYNFLISASSFFTFFTWILILWTFLRWRKTEHAKGQRMSFLAFGQPVSTVITMLVILILTGYALIQRDQRLGFYACLVMMVCLAIGYVFTRRHHQATNGNGQPY